MPVELPETCPHCHSRDIWLNVGHQRWFCCNCHSKFLTNGYVFGYADIIAENAGAAIQHD